MAKVPGKSSVLWPGWEIGTAMIDTHVHHWDLERFRYPWLDDPAFDDLRKDYLPADYWADAVEAPVEGWVHIQAEVDHQFDPVAAPGGLGSLPPEGTPPAA